MAQEDIFSNIDFNDLEDLDNIFDDLFEQQKKLGKELKSTLSDVFEIQQQLAEKAKEELEYGSESGKLYKELAKIYQEQLNNVSSFNVEQLRRFKVEKELKKLNLEYGTKEYEQAELYLSGLKQKIDNLLKEDKMRKTLLEKLKEEDEILEEMKSKTKDYLLNIQKVWMTFKVMIRNPQIAGALFMVSLAEQAGKLFKAVYDTQQQLGLSANESLELSKNLASASLEGLTLGITLGQTAEAARALTEEMKTIHGFSKDAIKQVAKLSSWYGVSAQESAKLYKLFTQLEPVSKKTADDMFKSYENIAKMNGVPIGELMQEVAQNTEFFALHAKDGGENIAKAAASALKLGLSLNDVQTIADKLLDVESSIRAENEAMAYLGHEINLNKAREYAMMGDYDKMMQEILNNQISIAEWDKLLYPQRKKLAEALGLSVEQMQTLIANQKKLNDLYYEEDSFWKRNFNRIMASVKALGEYKDVLITGVNFAASLSLIWTNMGGVIKNIGSKIGGIVKGSFSLVKNSLKWIGNLVKGKGIQKALETKSVVSKAPELTKVTKQATTIQQEAKKIEQPKALKQNNLVHWLNEWKKLDWKAVLKFSAVAGILIVSLPLTAKALKSFNDVSWDSALKGMGSLMVLVLQMKLIGNLGQGIMKGAAALGIMSLSLLPLSKALINFNKVDWSSLAKAGVAIGGLTLALMALGALMTTGVGAVLFGSGVLAITALGASLSVLGVGLQLVTQPLQNMTPILQELASIEYAKITEGFIQMSTGLLSLTGSLAVLTPLIPTLAALTKLSSKLEKTQINIERKQSEQTYKVVEEISKKIDAMIEIMKQGSEIKIGDREMGKYLGLKFSSMKTHKI